MAVSVKINIETNEEKHKITLLYVDISNLNQTVQFLLCSGAVFVFYILYGYTQELIFTQDGFQPYGWFLTLVQFGFCTIFGFFEKAVTHVPERR